MYQNAPSDGSHSSGPVWKLGQPLAPVPNGWFNYPLHGLVALDEWLGEAVDGHSVVVAKGGEDDLVGKKPLKHVIQVLHAIQL